MANNLDIRIYAKSKGVFLYEVAKALHISEPTIMRRLRDDLSEDRKAEIISAIDEVAAQHTSGTATA